MSEEFPDGTEVYRESYFRGLRPDPDLWVAIGAHHGVWPCPGRLVPDLDQ